MKLEKQYYAMMYVCYLSCEDMNIINSILDH